MQFTGTREQLNSRRLQPHYNYFPCELLHPDSTISDHSWSSDLPLAFFFLSTKCKDCSNGGEYLLSHSPSGSILILCLGGKCCRDLGQDSSTDNQERSESHQEKSQSPLLGEGNRKASEKGGDPLDKDAQFVSNSSIDLINVTTIE